MGLGVCLNLQIVQKYPIVEPLHAFSSSQHYFYVFTYGATDSINPSRAFIDHQYDKLGPK